MKRIIKTTDCVKLKAINNIFKKKAKSLSFICLNVVTKRLHNICNDKNYPPLQRIKMLRHTLERMELPRNLITTLFFDYLTTSNVCLDDELIYLMEKCSYCNKINHYGNDDDDDDVYYSYNSFFHNLTDLYCKRCCKEKFIEIK